MSLLRSRAGAFAILALVVVLFLAAKHYLTRSPKYEQLDASGCYVGGKEKIRLAGSRLFNEDLFVTNYTIVPPSAGKHGYLLNVDNVTVLMKGGILQIEHGNDGFLWPISDNDIRILAAPDIDVRLQKYAC